MANLRAPIPVTAFHFIHLPETLCESNQVKARNYIGTV